MSTPRAVIPAPLQLMCVLAVAGAMISPTLGGDWIWDEYRLIVDSPPTHDLASIPSFFVANLAQASGDAGVASQGVDVYRPLYMVWFALCWAASGGKPLGFHVGLLGWHLLATALVWLHARRLSSRPGVAAAAALLFAWHPVTSEAWAVAGSVCDPMAAVFLLAAAWVMRRDRPTIRDGLWAGLLVACAFFSKETALLILPVATVWLLLRGVRWALLPSWLAAACYLVARFFALDGLSGTGASETQRLDALHHLPILFVDGLRGVVTMRPLGVRHLSYEYGPLPWWLSGACLALLVVITVLAVRAHRRAPGVLAALALYAFALAPVALVATVDGWGGFGRYLYLPTAALLLAATQAVEVYSPPRPAFAVALAVLFVLQLTALPTVANDWSSQEALSESGIRQAPQVGVHWGWLGKVRVKQGRYEEAIQLFETAESLCPEYADAWVCHADALRRMGRCPDAYATIARKEEVLGPGPRTELVASLCLTDEQRYDEAMARLVAALDAGGSPQLEALATELVKVHPGRWDFRDRLRSQLAAPEHAAAARVLIQVLDEGERVDPRPADGEKPDR